MKPVHHDNADWTLEDAKHIQHNILMLLQYFWPLCGSGVDFRPRIQQEITRCNTAAAILMSYSLRWHVKMVRGALRCNKGRGSPSPSTDLKDAAHGDATVKVPVIIWL